MPQAMLTTASLSPLHRADGSAIYSGNGYSVIAAVNGPIEVQRRDELPEAAAVDVMIRPASGLGGKSGVRERHLESIIQDVLRQVVLLSAHPRTLIQITLQIDSTQDDEIVSGALSQAGSSLAVLPVLLQASILALLSTSVPLSMILTAVLIAVDSSGKLTPDPSPQALRSASSGHVFAVSSLGDLLVAESWGNFSIETWDRVHKEAGRICCGEDDNDSDSEDVSLNSEGGSKLEGILRDAVQEKVARDLAWKQKLS